MLNDLLSLHDGLLCRVLSILILVNILVIVYILVLIILTLILPSKPFKPTSIFPTLPRFYMRLPHLPTKLPLILLQLPRQHHIQLNHPPINLQQHITFLHQQNNIILFLFLLLKWGSFVCLYCIFYFHVLDALFWLLELFVLFIAYELVTILVTLDLFWFLMEQD